MDALLADALRDFEDEDATTQQNQQAQQQVVADLAPPPCTQFPDPGPAEPLPGNVRGPTLPPRTSKVPSVAAGAATTSTATSSPGLQQRPLGGMPQLPTRSKKPQKTHEQQPVLRPEAQRLADEIMRLMEESGLDLGGNDEQGSAGQDPSVSGLPDASEFTSPALRGLAERALQAAEAEAATARAAGAATGAGSGLPAQPQYRSAALRALADQTKQTVEQQSKVSRGEGTSSAGGATASAPGVSGGGLFGDLFGMLNAVGGEGGAGGGPGGGMGVMVDYIMQNLLSKEVLYGPLKDIRDKYPPWLEANKLSLSAEDLQRYTAQYASIQAVCKQYEEDPSNFPRLTDLIQQMQTYGDPPSAIVDDMMPGGPDGLMGATGDPDDIGNFDMPDMDDLPKELKDKCPIQ